MSQYTVLNPLARALGNKGMTNVARNTRRILTKANNKFLASTGPNAKTGSNASTVNPAFGLKITPSPLTIRTPPNSPSTTPANSPRTPPVSTTANMGRFSNIIPRSPEPAPAANTRRINNNNRAKFPPQQARQGGRKSRKHKNKRRRN